MTQVNAVNVSLDVLDSAAFDAMAGGGDVDSVLAGIEASLALGQRIKMNTVPCAQRTLINWHHYSITARPVASNCVLLN